MAVQLLSPQSVSNWESAVRFRKKISRKKSEEMLFLRPPAVATKSETVEVAPANLAKNQPNFRVVHDENKMEMS